MANQCDYCKKNFSSQTGLSQHVAATKHTITCFRCKLTFQTASANAEHMRTSPKHNICRDCGVDLWTMKDLEDHMANAHHFCCPCNRNFSSGNALYKHDVEMHAFCELCSTYCTSPADLQEHLRVHHKGASTVPTPSIQTPVSQAKPVQDREEHAVECFGCTKTFSSIPPMISHFESGACPSGADGTWVIAVLCQSADVHGYVCRFTASGYELKCKTCSRSCISVYGLLAHANSDSCSESLDHGSPLSRFIKIVKGRFWEKVLLG